ncbi:hypothetical protein [Microbispora sitophila]|uniref:hypothetical protein n=1 Tax=Microbispora sitophila TaxID=2771537 RepID=UPI001D01EA6D|nr:hypothetical protein [Microbispora sitophila]
MIAANPELREREALKGLGLTASMTHALMRRGVPDLTACVAAELGALALKIAYERWSDTTDGDRLRRTRAAHTRRPAGSQCLVLTRTRTKSRHS